MRKLLGPSSKIAPEPDGGPRAPSPVESAAKEKMPPKEQVAAEPKKSLLSPTMLEKLTELDDRIVEAFNAEDIKLLRAAWLLAQPASYRVMRRQDLEIIQAELEAKGEVLTPFLSAGEAVRLVRHGERGAGVVSQ